MMNSITRLAESTAMAISGSSRMPDVCQIVEELIFNSIDAKASFININVDLSQFKLQVSDTGIGFTEETFAVRSFFSPNFLYFRA